MRPRAHPYTIEGQIEQLGDFAAGANRARGWRRLTAKAFIVGVFLVPFAVSLLSMLWNTFR